MLDIQHPRDSRVTQLDGNVYAHLIPVRLMISDLEATRYYTLPEAIDSLAHWFHCGHGHILVAAGVDELIMRLMPYLAKKVNGVLMAYPTYPLYRSLCETLGIPFREIVTLSSMGEQGVWPPPPDQCKGQLVVIVNPENPTGSCLDTHMLCRVIEDAPSAVFLVDESYIDFCPDESLLPLVGCFPNLIVLRGFSKGLGLPGLRIGAGITGDRILLENYYTEYFSMSISGLSIECLKMIQASAMIQRFLALNRAVRRWQTVRIARTMRRLALPVHDSHTNLLFCHLPQRQEERIAREAHRRGIVYTRPNRREWLDRYYAKLTDDGMSYLRFSCGIGTYRVIRMLHKALR